MSKPIVDFHAPFSIASEKLKYSIICSRYQNNWVFVRHKHRNTYEMPAGHIEKGESALAAARRELYEETGATHFSLRTVFDYSCEWQGEIKSGRIFFASIQQLGKLPEHEIAEVKLLKVLPRDLTYPEIQKLIFERVSKYLKTI